MKKYAHTHKQINMDGWMDGKYELWLYNECEII